jgi:hypothetical protein
MTLLTIRHPVLSGRAAGAGPGLRAGGTSRAAPGAAGLTLPFCPAA